MATTCHQLSPTNNPTSYSNTNITMHNIEQIDPATVDDNESCPGLDT